MGLNRKIESTSDKEVSTATFKDYKITITVEREQEKVKLLNFNGYKSSGEIFSGSLREGGQANISFTPLTATDAEIAQAMSAEIEIITKLSSKN